MFTGCKIKDNLFKIINIIKSLPIEISLVFFVFMILVTIFFPNSGTFSALVASFGAIFVALKYKLDQVSYHKALFEDRYAIFTEIDKVLWGFFHGEDWCELVQKMDLIYRKSYFLFGNKTYQFISEFRQAVIDASHISKDSKDPKVIEKVNKANEFLQDLLVEQELAKKFSELKIDTY